MNVTEVAGVRVRQWGREDGSPLVYWHALNPFGALQLIEAGPAWAERGFRVLAIAAPGGGDSPALADPDSYRPTRLAQLTIAVANALAIRALRLHRLLLGGLDRRASRCGSLEACRRACAARRRSHRRRA